MKKCFFCDGPARPGMDKYDEYLENGLHFIQCAKCGFKLAGFDTYEEAEKEWNRMEWTADAREKINPELFAQIALPGQPPVRDYCQPGMI